MNKPTRFYSNRQEKKVAKDLGGKQTANSGATGFVKGDVNTSQFLLECKTCCKPQKTFTIQKAWIEKNREEAFAMHKPYSAVAFDFGDDEEQYYIIDKKLMKILMRFLEEEN